MNIAQFPRVQGQLTRRASLAKLVWFRTGGEADWLLEPANLSDLSDFLKAMDNALPIMPLGLGSNLIIRDRGVEGLVIRLGKPFTNVEILNNKQIKCGGGASGILVSSAARDAGISGLEFLRGIPGTVGGFVKMNGGAYGAEVSSILIECEVVLSNGDLETLSVSDLCYSYRRSSLPEQAVVVSAIFEGKPSDPKIITVEMDRIARAREETQPLRTKTGGSTFKNPPAHLGAGRKAWELIDAAGCRGLMFGGAQVSEKHANFLINLGSATSTEIETLGEEVYSRVLESTGVNLEWEIERVGRL